MPIAQWIVLALLIFMFGYTVMLYNNLVNLKHRVSQAFANIDVLMKQRHDELPKLVEACKRYMTYEQETLSRIIEARSQVAEARQRGDMPALGGAETMLRAGLGQLFALVENYPELKADQSFQFLQQRVTALEHSIADRREVYNEAVNNNNIRIEQFPDVLLARFFSFKPFELLRFQEEELKDPDLKQLFG